jgi:hypothetical protein
MIISASRRTDIPAFYAEWFIKRLRAGYCTVPNPYNHRQVTRVALTPEDVDVIVFWTRNPRPLFSSLDELDNSGYRYYFQFTLLNYPRIFETSTPPLETALRAFQDLSDRVGPERMIWRYDPIIFSQHTGIQFHIETYQQIAEALHGVMGRSVISIMDLYGKIKRRIEALNREGAGVVDWNGKPGPRFDHLMRSLAEIAAQNDMQIFSCAEETDLAPYGILPGKCVDDDYIAQVFGIQVGYNKDPGQRKVCGCVVSRDIGMYESCPFGCQYCYANGSFERDRQNYQAHDPDSPSLLGWIE